MTSEAGLKASPSASAGQGTRWISAALPLASELISCQPRLELHQDLSLIRSQALRLAFVHLVLVA